MKTIFTFIAATAACLLVYSTALPAQAQDEHPLNIAGEYIGVHHMVALAVKHCNYTDDREYDRFLGAAIVRYYLTPDHQKELDIYINSEAFPQDLDYLQEKYDQSFALLKDTGMDDAEACKNLIEVILEQFHDTERKLKTLR